MAKFEKRLKARELRKKGWSIKSIASHLNVSKGSSSLWCRDVKLTLFQERRLRRKMIKAGHRGRMIGAEMNKRKKQESVKHYLHSGKKDFGSLSKRDFLIAGISLYWGEGSKTDTSPLNFVNSDSEMILFMYKWFQEVLGVKKEDFLPRISINEMHKPRINKVLEFWSRKFQLPISQFGNPYFVKVKQKKIYKNYDDYFGVLSLRVRKSSKLKYKMIGLVKALRNQVL